MRWNLKEAALACNVPQGSWREWELFDRVPRNLVEVAGKISARTGYDDYWIMTGNQKAPVNDGGQERARRDSNPQPSVLETGAPESGAVILDITDRLTVGPAVSASHQLAPVVVLR